MVRVGFHKEFLPSKHFLQLSISDIAPCLNLAVEVDGITLKRVDLYLNISGQSIFSGSNEVHVV